MQPYFVRVFSAGSATGLAAPLATTFDDAVSSLSHLPQLLIEPDGSFVFSGEHQGARWQIDGTLIDGGAKLFYVELKGHAPPGPLDQLLACFSSGSTPLVFAPVEGGELMSAAEFRRAALE